jgi:hypothetical protein
MRCATRLIVLAAALALTVGNVGPAEAGIVLTGAGAAQGFSLSTFASGFPSRANGDGTIGPLGIAFPSSGGVLVGDVFGNIYRFATDTDGQTAPAPSQSFGGDNAQGMASSGGSVYLAQRDGLGRIVQLNNDGSTNQVIATGLIDPTGMAVDPINGHLFVSSIGSGTIYDIDPMAKTATVTPIAARLDGRALSADGQVLYGAGVDSNSQLTGHVLSYSTATGALLSDITLVGDKPDGVALGYGALVGKLFANGNQGHIIENDLATQAQTVIAEGGSRGDFVSVDPNGSLLLTQSDSIVRLTAPPGGGFVASPEPSTLVGGSLGVALALGYAWRRRRARAATTGRSGAALKTSAGRRPARRATPMP